MDKYQSLLWELDDIRKQKSALSLKEKEIFEIIKKDKGTAIEKARKGEKS